MKRIRVIPVLLLHKGGLVKSKRFKDYKYVGDPINAVRIFNEKEIDEIIVLDIDATRENRGPRMNQLKQIAGEAFIPLAYGGGITTIEQAKALFYLGLEKIVINNTALQNPALITEAAKLVGSQSVVVSIDFKKNMFGKRKVYGVNGTKAYSEDLITYVKKVESYGAGEIFLNSIEQDGTYSGYDQAAIKEVSNNLHIPVVACGGAAGVDDFVMAVSNGASAVAAGSIFVFQRPHNAVLISYPSQKELKEKFYSRI